MSSHSPRKCLICGGWHCLAGCVPVEQCRERVGLPKNGKKGGEHHGKDKRRSVDLPAGWQSRIMPQLLSHFNRAVHSKIVCL